MYILSMVWSLTVKYVYFIYGVISYSKIILSMVWSLIKYYILSMVWSLTVKQ